MKLIYQQNKEIINTDDVCKGCGNSAHYGQPFILEQYDGICFNGIFVEVTKKEMKEFKKSVDNYGKGEI